MEVQLPCRQPGILSGMQASCSIDDLKAGRQHMDLSNVHCMSLGACQPEVRQLAVT